MRQAVEIQLRALPLAVSRAAWQMGLEYRKPQVECVSEVLPPAEPEPAPLQLIAEIKPSKKCLLCDEIKPLTGFLKSATSADGRRSTCTACQRSEAKPRERLEAHAKQESKAVAGLETLQSLTTRAIKAKARSAVFKAGRVKIEAKYSKADSEVTYFVNEWPRHPEFVEMLLERIHSGVGTGNLLI
jgi:hypothetical protein